MHSGVHLITEPNDTLETLRRYLAGSEYRVTFAAPDALLPQHNPPPAVYIVDLASFDKHPESLWETFVSHCQAQAAACLAYHSTDGTDRSRLDRLKPAAEWLFDPWNPAEITARINTLQTIRRLTRQYAEVQQRARHQQEELQEALQSAAEIQRRLIPEQYPDYQKLSYAWRFMPSRKVGGDLFNVAHLDEKTIMTYLVDVSGHGISSAMVSVAIQQSLSPHTGHIPKRQVDTPPYYTIHTPAAVMADLEREYPFERFEEFFTLIYLLIDEASGAVRYCSAGHPAPILVRSSGKIERLECGGTIIGLGNLVAFEEGEIQMRAGDRLFLYTDGVTEHGLSNGEAFGPERLEECLQSPHPDGLEGTMEHTVKCLHAFGDNREPLDDITLIGIRFSG